MNDWREKARAAIWTAAYSNDPEAVPVYRVPKPKPWWAFWRPTEWETITGMSRAQWATIAKNLERYQRGRS